MTTTTTRQAICRYCNGLRDVSASGICMGCGSDVARNAPTTIHRQQRCPKCTDGSLVRFSNGIHRTCFSCGYISGTPEDRLLNQRGNR